MKLIRQHQLIRYGKNLMLEALSFMMIFVIERAKKISL